MAKHKRLFNRFREHVVATVVSYDATKRLLHYDVEDASGCSDRLQSGMDFDASSLTPGARIRMQYGETTNWTSSSQGGLRMMMIGKRKISRQIYTGYRCINAIAYVQPRVTLLTLRVMEQMLGAEATAEHLADFARDASSLQTEIDEKATGLPLWFRVERGILYGGATIQKDPTLQVDRNTVLVTCGDLPETLLNALVGSHIGQVVDHPMLRDEEFVIDRTQPNGSMVRFDLDRTVLTIDDAIGRLRFPLPKAA